MRKDENKPFMKPDARKTDSEIRDRETDEFLRHLASDRGASIYTQRNYRQALRDSELCGLLADDIHWGEQVVRVRGKGRKERLVPIGAPALRAIQDYWSSLPHPPGGDTPVFLANARNFRPMYPRLAQLRLKGH